MKHETAHQQIGRALGEGWTQGGSFFGSILSGMLLGLLTDRWLGTEPWLVIIGSMVGIYSGFHNMWKLSKNLGETEDES